MCFAKVCRCTHCRHKQAAAVHCCTTGAISNIDAALVRGRWEQGASRCVPKTAAPRQLLRTCKV